MEEKMYVDILEWFDEWERGAADYGNGLYSPPMRNESLREAYDKGNHAAQKAWVAQKKGTL